MKGLAAAQAIAAVGPENLRLKELIRLRKEVKSEVNGNLTEDLEVEN